MHKERGFFRACHVGLCHDFDKRGAGTVVVDVGMLSFHVEGLSYVFLKVNALDADAAVFFVGAHARLALKVVGAEFASPRLLVLGIMEERKVNVAVSAERQVVLGYLVALGKVGIKIVLSVKLGEARDVAVEREARHRSKLHVALAYARHGSGKPQANRANAGVGHSAVTVFASAKGLGFSQKLRVNFAADYDFCFFDRHRSYCNRNRIFFQLRIFRKTAPDAVSSPA